LPASRGGPRPSFKTVAFGGVIDPLDPDGTNPFRHAHEIILNLAIGGNSGGDPAATSFPARFEIDYVRIYQQQ
jgi:beta-glucanase (GH16 family)